MYMSKERDVSVTRARNWPIFPCILGKVFLLVILNLLMGAEEERSRHPSVSHGECRSYEKYLIDKYPASYSIVRDSRLYSRRTDQRSIHISMSTIPCVIIKSIWRPQHCDIWKSSRILERLGYRLQTVSYAHRKRYHEPGPHRRGSMCAFLSVFVTNRTESPSYLLILLRRSSHAAYFQI